MCRALSMSDGMHSCHPLCGFPFSARRCEILTDKGPNSASALMLSGLPFYTCQDCFGCQKASCATLEQNMERTGSHDREGHAWSASVSLGQGRLQ